jgi:hypothetical protein
MALVIILLLAKNIRLKAKLIGYQVYFQFC